ncbi:MAG: hypothetical protein HY548_04510 [Elusimicrobia bacterium]|nr:hypothetical protein [Elusimicrobiota bacterium]
MKNYRQGEVLIFGEERLKGPLAVEWKKRAKLVPDNVIIEGELAGHKHEVVNGKLYQHPDKKDVMILEAGDGCFIKHPEHKDVPMPKGVYEVNIQREYDEGKARKVKD